MLKILKKFIFLENKILSEITKKINLKTAETSEYKKVKIFLCINLLVCSYCCASELKENILQNLSTETPAEVSKNIQKDSLKEEEVISFTIDNEEQAKPSVTSIFIGLLSSDNSELNEILSIVKADLERSGQFKITIEPKTLPKTKEDITDLFDKGFVFAFFIDELEDKTGFKWLLYDPAQPQEKIGGKKLFKQNFSTRTLGHILADQIWNELMGSSSSFSSKICYIKRVTHPKYRFINKLCICDFDGSNEKELVSSPRIIVAPYWGFDASNPFIVYSEFTKSNVRLMSIDLFGNKKPVIDFDGTNVGVSFSSNGENVAYCRSGNIWLYKYDPLLKKGIHARIIKENDICASPNLLSNGDVIYCSKAKIKKYHANTKRTENIINNGYNVSPSYHEKSHRIVYSKRVNDTMQIFVYNMKTKKNEQLTFDFGDKIDPCWSSCGNWVIFCVEGHKKSRIKVLNIKTKKQEFIFKDSPAGENFFYPSCSKNFYI